MDIISELSDELLIQILSFLPTKVAVSTSILSKRWEYLWMWLPNLEYSDRHSSPSECKSLQCFLDRCLPLHRAHVIDRFCLELSSSLIQPANIKLWIVIAISRCLRELEIYYSSYQPDILPSNLFTCKSLVVLKLDGGILLDVPRMAFLPSLKTLQLQSMGYYNEESLPRLLSYCPVLENLSVELRENDFMGKLAVVVPSLRSLSLYIPYHYHIDGIVIDTPLLKYFKLKDYNNKNHYCLIQNMPNLIEAYLDVELPNIKSLIGSITSVKRLVICSKAMCDEGFVFNQLEHLKVCRCKEHSSNLLVRLLKDSSNLQVLELFEMDFHHYHNETVNWNQPSTVPRCMLSSLQTVNWLVYTGERGERDLAVYILKNAVRIKTIRIKSFESDVTKFEMLKDLALHCRASTTCQLVFD